MVDHPDPRKTDRPENEKTAPDVPKPPPPAAEAENEDLIVTQDSGQFAPEGEPQQPPSHSSAVDLGRAQAPPPSGQAGSDDASSFPWEDLVPDEKQPSSGGSGEPAEFDSPSDVDVLRHAAIGEDGSDLDLSDSAISAAAGKSRDSSRVDLAEGATDEDPFSSGPPPEFPPEPIAGDSDVFVAEAAAEQGEPVESQAQVFTYDSSAELEGGVREVEEGSGVDLGPAHAAPRAEDSSGIDLGGGGRGSGAPIVIDSSSDLDLEGAIILDDDEGGEEPSSVVELGASEPVITVDSASVLPSSKQEGLPEESSQSDVFVGADVGPAVEAVSSGTSGLDLGQPSGPAIQVDSSSGMDISVAAGELDEESMGTISLSEGKALPEAGDAASSVNLGMALEEKGSDRDLIAEAVESGVDLERPPAAQRPEAGSDVVDVRLGPGAAVPGDSSVDLGAPAVADDEGNLAADFLKESEAAPDLGLDVTREWQPGDSRGQGAAVPGEEVDDSAVRTFEDHLPEGVAAEQEEMIVGSESVVQEGAEEADAGSLVTEEETEERAEKEEEEEERRVPPPKPKYGRRLVGGALIGTLVGGAACVGLWMYGVEPPKAWRQVATTSDDQQERPGGRPPGGGSLPPGGGRPATLDDLLSSGDFSKEPPPINEADAGERTKRGRYLLLQYLAGTDPKAYKLTDDAVKNALADLNEGVKGDNADALLWKGFVYESMNKRKEAEDAYKSGKDKFKKDPRFEGALDRLDLRGALLSPPLRLDATQLALLVLLLQPPMPPGQPPGQPAGPQPEAGFSFWSAAKLARDRKFDDALKALAAARKVHEETRRSRLAKPQNPHSDPFEDIFLRTCDELKVYWELQKKLGDRGYLADKKTTPGEALDAVLTALVNTKKDADELKLQRDDLEKKKKDAETKAAMLGTDLDKEKKAKTDALELVKDRDNKLKKAADDLKAETGKLVKATERGDGLQKEKTDLQKTLVQVGDELKLKNLDPKKDRETLVRKLKDVIGIANTKDAGGQLAASMEEVRRQAATLAQRWTPETMLSYWLPLLADRSQKELATAAVKDVQRVRADDKASAAAKALALAVEGLAQRNRGEFTPARQALKAAEEAGRDAAWRSLVEKARKELNDPAEFYLPRADALRGQGRFVDALAVLDEGLKAFPDRTGRLLSLRSLVRLDDAMAKVRGKLLPDSPGIKEAREDAEAAIKAGSEGAGHFAAGRIAEALGQRDAAAARYRQAVGEAPAGSDELSRYSLALARLLLQQAEGRGAMRSGPLGRETAVAGRPLSARELLVLVMVGLQPPPEEMSQKEALELARKILERKDIDRMPLLKAQAQAIQGMWTQALNTYVEGLRPHLSRDQFEGLKYIVENHPVQRRPDRLRVPHPFQAEQHYVIGLGRFHAQDFAGAEKEFAKAIGNFDQDARYHYFLGLARLQQGKRGAPEEFDEAARLEADGRPVRDAVDAALERIQGEPRRLIKEARGRVR